MRTGKEENCDKREMGELNRVKNTKWEQRGWGQGEGGKERCEQNHDRDK